MSPDGSATYEPVAAVMLTSNQPARCRGHPDPAVGPALVSKRRGKSLLHRPEKGECNGLS